MSPRLVRSRPGVCCLILLGVLAQPGSRPARAEAVLDQSFTSPPLNVGAVINEGAKLIAQTFTAGRTGPLVGVNVDVQGSGPYPLRVAIRTTNTSGAPTSTVLGSTMLPTSSAPLSLLVPFDPPIPIEAGKSYAIVVDYPTGPPPGGGNAQGVWPGSSAVRYSGGSAYAYIVNLQPPPPSGWMRGNYDLYFRTYVDVNQIPDCGQAVAAPGEIWPPDGRLVPIEIVGVTDPDGDPVTITATAVTQDEPVREGTTARWLGESAAPLDPKGTPAARDECPDAVIVNGVAHVRAERSGSGGGRVYAISFTAGDGEGGECQGQVTVCVPHDRGRNRECVDDGQTVNSLECGSVGPRISEGLAVAVLRSLPGPGATRALEYRLPAAGDVSLSVYDISGRRVRTLEAGHRPAGIHRLEWITDGIRPGVYFYRLGYGGSSVGAPLVILR